MRVLQSVRMTVWNAVRMDRTGLVPSKHPVRLAIIGIPIIGILYWIEFGGSIEISLTNLLGGKVVDAGGYLGPLNEWEIARIDVIRVIIIICILGVAYILRRLISPSCEQLKITWNIQLLAFVLGLFIFSTANRLSFVISYFMSYFDVRYQYVDTRMITIGPFAEFLDFANNFIGPLEEESLLLALLVTCLRRSKIPWRVILVLNSLMRGVFHLYQGWPALRAFIWPIFIVLLYRCTGALLGICLSHCVWDVVLYLFSSYYDIVGLYVMAFSVFIVIIYLVTTILRNALKN